MDSIVDVKKRLGHAIKDIDQPATTFVSDKQDDYVLSKEFPLETTKDDNLTVSERAMLSSNAKATESGKIEVKEKSQLDIAALNFGLYFPEFKRRVYKLSRKSLMRIIVSIMGHPLESDLPNMKRDDEREAFSIAQSLADAKLVLILDALYKKNKDLAAATTPPTESELIQYELERLKKLDAEEAALKLTKQGESVNE